MNMALLEQQLLDEKKKSTVTESSADSLNAPSNPGTGYLPPLPPSQTNTTTQIPVDQSPPQRFGAGAGTPANQQGNGNVDLSDQLEALRQEKELVARRFDNLNSGAVPNSGNPTSPSPPVYTPPSTTPPSNSSLPPLPPTRSANGTGASQSSVVDDLPEAGNYTPPNQPKPLNKSEERIRDTPAIATVKSFESSLGVSDP